LYSSSFIQGLSAELGEEENLRGTAENTGAGEAEDELKIRGWTSDRATPKAAKAERGCKLLLVDLANEAMDRLRVDWGRQPFLPQATTTLCCSSALGVALNMAFKPAGKVLGKKGREIENSRRLESQKME